MHNIFFLFHLQYIMCRLTCAYTSSVTTTCDSFHQFSAVPMCRSFGMCLKFHKASL